MADQKEAIRETAEAIIQMLEEASTKRQVDKHTKMSQVKEKLEHDLQNTMEAEELKQSSEWVQQIKFQCGLTMFITSW